MVPILLKKAYKKQYENWNYTWDKARNYKTFFNY